MPADVVNLRLARKRKGRAEHERQAERNRLRFGRSKADKARDEAQQALETRRLEASRIERPGTDSSGATPDPVKR